MVLNPDFREFVELLNANDVRYLVVDGYAVAFHGHPRYTKDMDVWIWPDKENLRKLIGTLDEFGFGSLNLQIDDFFDPEIVIQLGYPPNRIDLLTDLKGVDFHKCFASRKEANIEGVKIKFIDLENLKKNRRLRGRHQDLADLENLE